MSKSSVMMKRGRQRHLPNLCTLVVTMNWNRFRNIFRIRFRIFYNRSELSHCITIVATHCANIIDLHTGQTTCSFYHIFTNRKWKIKECVAKTGNASQHNNVTSLKYKHWSFRKSQSDCQKSQHFFIMLNPHKMIFLLRIYAVSRSKYLFFFFSFF